MNRAARQRFLDSPLVSICFRCLSCLAVASGVASLSATEAQSEPYRILDLAVTENDGDWAEQHIEIVNTEEAELIVRAGDIDNMNAGWRIAYDPFSGERSRELPSKWEVAELDVAGTDRVMVVGGPRQGDVFASSLAPEEFFVEGVMSRFVPPPEIRSVHLQMFVSGIEQKKSATDFRFFIDGEEAEEISAQLRTVGVEDGEGALLTFRVPFRFNTAFESGEVNLELNADQPMRSNGFAIDFVKILINKTGFQRTGEIEGTVMDKARKRLVKGAMVSAQGIEVKTDAQGAYRLKGVAAGQVVVKVAMDGEPPVFRAISLKGGEKKTSHF